MSQDNKKVYITPEIKVTLIELEESIASGSAKVKPGDTNGQVQQEWDEQPDAGKTYNW